MTGYKTILLLVTGDDAAATNRLEVALALASACEAHLVALSLVGEPQIYPAMGVSFPIDLLNAERERSEARADELLAGVRAAADRAGVPIDTRRETALVDNLGDVFAQHGRHADLVIVGQPDPDTVSAGDSMLVETAFMSTGPAGADRSLYRGEAGAAPPDHLLVGRLEGGGAGPARRAAPARLGHLRHPHGRSAGASGQSGGRAAGRRCRDLPGTPWRKGRGQDGARRGARCRRRAPFGGERSGSRSHRHGRLRAFAPSRDRLRRHHRAPPGPHDDPCSSLTLRGGTGRPDGAHSHCTRPLAATTKRRSTRSPRAATTSSTRLLTTQA